MNFNKKVKCIVFSYKNEYIKYKKLSKNNGRSYPRTNEVYTITNNDTNSNSLHAYINNIKYNNVQLHGNEIATTDLKSSVLNERVSQSSEFEHCPTYYSFKNKNLHCQNGEKTVLEPALYKNAAMPLENANFYKGTSTPKILNVLSMSTNNLKLNSLYHIFDVNSKQLYIIDSGSTVSCFKASEEDKKETIGFLTAANGTKINIYDVQTKTVNFLLRRDYVHNFIICDVVCNILGLDFFEKYNFLIDFSNHKIMDAQTGSSCDVIVGNDMELVPLKRIDHFINVTFLPKLPSAPSLYSNLLFNFKELFTDLYLNETSELCDTGSTMVNENVVNGKNNDGGSNLNNSSCSKNSSNKFKNNAKIRGDINNSDNSVFKNKILKFPLTPAESDALNELVPYKFNVRGPPINIKSRRISTCLYDKAKVEIGRLVNAGVLSPSHSPWGFPISVLPKPSGGVRIVADLRLLNKRAVRDNFSLPNLGDFSNILCGAKVFSVLDLKKAFYNLKVHPDCKKFLTINTPYGSFSYNSIVEGFHSSPTSFTKYISLILSRIPNIFIYIDDILIATPTHEEHLKVLEMVFDRLNYFNLKLSADKCKIAQPKVTYLGFDVTEGFMLPSEDKSLAILHIPKPKTIKDLRSFLGSINYFRSSLPGISNTISPLLSFLKGAPYSQRRVKWNPEAEEAFNLAKLTLKNATPLGFPSNNAKISIFTDASHTALAGVVVSTENEKTVPLGFYSYKLNPTEMSYSIFSKELLALVKTVKKFQHIVEGRKVDVFCDNLSVTQSLKKETDANHLLAREQRYLTFLSEYDLNISHIKSEENILADYLSRNPAEQTTMSSLKLPVLSNTAENADATSPSLQIGREDTVTEVLPEAICDEALVTPELFPQQDSLIEDECYSLSSIFHISANEVFKLFQAKIDYKELQAAQETDVQLQKYLNKQENTNLKLTKRNYYYKNDLLSLVVDESIPFSPRIFVPESFITPVISYSHSLGHFGVKKTLASLRKRFVWKDMPKYTKQFVLSCDSCQRSKSLRRISPPYESYQPVSAKFQVVHIDILKMPSCKNYKYLLTLIDRFSRYLFAFPLKNIETSTIVETITREFLPVAGVVGTYVSDRGGQFTSDLFTSVCEELGSRHNFTSAYTPQSNGLIENSHRTLLRSLRAMLSDELEDVQNYWWDLLPLVLLCLRTAPLNSEGITPAILMMGQNPSLPGALIEQVESSFPLSIKTYAEKLKLFLGLPLSPEFSAKNPKIYVPKNLQDAKFVLVKNQQYGRNKLEAIYHGPYPIVKFSGNNVYIKKNNKVISENIINIKPYFSLSNESVEQGTM